MTGRLAILWSGLAILALTLIGFFVFPGHTFLQSDTQVYVPFLEHQHDPSVLARDVLAQNPSLRFTIYDETALLLRRATGLPFQSVLAGEQILFRMLGLAGVFLIASALGLHTRLALLVTAVFSLGAVIAGPSVLTIEYEPVPRAFAIPLLLLAIGLAAHGRTLAAGIAAAVACLYHPPSAIPVCLCLLALRRRVLVLVPLAVAVILLLLLPGAEPQSFFGRIGPELERIQRTRASYNWVSTWPGALFAQYAFLWLFSVSAYLRVRMTVMRELRPFLLGLPLLGLLSLPLSYLLLEKLKWIAAPQLQPARAVLFVTAFAVILGTAAGLKAARPWESALWLLPVAAVLLLPFFALPRTTYARVSGPELDQLVSWTRVSTPRDAVFLFPDAAHDLTPGIFRAKALRALYVDWKSGGQANFQEAFARDWWSRWQNSGYGKTVFPDLSRYRDLGVDYVVLKPTHRPPGAPLFENAAFAVYRTGPAL